MNERNLKSELSSMVRAYGIDRVFRSLEEIRTSNVTASVVGPEGSGERGKPKTGRSKAKPTALDYIDRMDVENTKKAALVELGRRFQKKTFLPNFGDIRNFCQIYGIEEPASKSRTSAMPRIFEFIASMSVGDIKRMVDEDMFSGPSRLGPIAEAIRRSGRASKRREMGDASGGLKFGLTKESEF